MASPQRTATPAFPCPDPLHGLARPRQCLPVPQPCSSRPVEVGRAPRRCAEHHEGGCCSWLGMVCSHAGRHPNSRIAPLCPAEESQEAI